MNSFLFSGASTPDPAPNHAEIAQCARELWTIFGCPRGQDDEIWLEAERRLISAQRARLPASELSHTLSQHYAPARLAPRAFTTSFRFT
jgi:hypothetical protein